MTSRKETQEVRDSERAEPRGGGARRRGGDLAATLVVVVGLALAVSLARLAEACDLHREARVPAAAELYVTPEAARRMSLAFNGLVADWYWLRSLQYVGRKIDAYQGDVQLDDLSPVGLTSLAALLDQATTLDPQFMAAYQFGAIVLPAVDVGAAIRLAEKGIRANPREWRLYQHLGYIYWQQGRFREAGEAYHAGARIPGAPAWFEAMAAQMEASGGSRATARAIYRRMYTEGEDLQVRKLAAGRLLQLESLDQRDSLGQVLGAYRRRVGRCPASWREVAAALRASGHATGEGGAPLDPTGVPYVLEPSSCAAELDPSSQILRK